MILDTYLVISRVVWGHKPWLRGGLDRRGKFQKGTHESLVSSMSAAFGEEAMFIWQEPGPSGCSTFAS